MLTPAEFASSQSRTYPQKFHNTLAAGCNAILHTVGVTAAREHGRIKQFILDNLSAAVDNIIR